MSNTEGDVRLFQTNDKGNITLQNGIVLMGGGLETAAYTSLFGGNLDDDGRPDNNKTWWANLDEPITTRRIKSETQFLLRSIPATSANLIRIQDAVKRDLQWMIGQEVASSVDATVTIPTLNKISIVIDIEAVGEQSSFKFIANWEAQ